MRVPASQRYVHSVTNRKVMLPKKILMILVRSAVLVHLAAIPTVPPVIVVVVVLSVWREQPQMNLG